MAQDSDQMLTNNPLLSYLNQILMEEGIDADDDAACMQQIDSVSYQATLSGFYELLGNEYPHPYASCVDSVCGSDASDAHPSQCKGAAEQHVKVVSPIDGSYNTSKELVGFGASGISTLRPCPANAHSSCQEDRADVGCASKHGATPLLLTTPVPELHEMKKGMPNSGPCLKSYGLNGASVSSSFGYDTGSLKNLNPNNTNDANAAVEGVSDHSCMQGREQGNDIFNLQWTDEEFSSKLSEVEVSFEDFRLKDLYTDLYVGELISSASSAAASRVSKQSGNGKKKLVGKGRETGRDSTFVFVDVTEALVSCAQAVEVGDARRATEILRELHQVHGASANGTSSQRIAHFFGKALAARMRGGAELQCRAMSEKMPFAVTLLHATMVAFELISYLMVIHYYANQSILQAVDGASRLHIVDYGLAHGIQWPCLIRALADRRGGPPLLVITGIEFSQPGVNPGRRLEKTGRQLAAYAKTHNVPFQYHGIVCKTLEDRLDVASLNLHEGEVLVVNCIKCLRQLADESVDLTLDTSPRQELLTFMRSLNPHLFLTAVANAPYSSPFFVTRFREALRHFSNLFDMLATLWGDTPQRLMLERSHFYRDILNVVGCEGAERVDRPETYKQWHGRITKAGFEQLPIPPLILSRSQSHVKQHYHKDFFIHDDIGKGWMLVGWKGCTTFAFSAWKPSLVQHC